MEGRFTIEVPGSVGADGRQVIGEHAARLGRAFEVDDRPAVLGSAKDLVETVSRVILAARNETPNLKSLGSHLTSVHRSLDSAQGQGRAAEEPLLTMLKSVRVLVEQLAPMRNEAGTGHGRAAPVTVTREQMSVATDAAVLWCRWALARFDVVYQSSPASLVALLDSSIFYKNEVAEHLAELHLDDLPEPDLDRLGRALAHRGGWRDTRVVWSEGVAPVLRAPETFPRALLRGLLFGLFFARDGAIATSQLTTEAAAKLALQLGEVGALEDLRDELATASLSIDLRADAPARIAESIRENSTRFPDGDLKAAWTALAERFEPAPAGE